MSTRQFKYRLLNQEISQQINGLRNVIKRKKISTEDIATMKAKLAILENNRKKLKENIAYHQIEL